jgi:uncharacterized protein involved in response to NO
LEGGFLEKINDFRLFALGFRPFFLGAAFYAVLGMGGWALYWQGQQVPGMDSFGQPHWFHAHGMIFGYSTAVIAGFLLTAIRNWTGQLTLNGWPLAAVFTLWVAARVMPFLTTPIELIAAIDLGFNLSLIIAVTIPLVKAGRWKDIATFSTKLVLLMVANAIVYLGAIDHGPGQRVGIYLGLYIVLAIIMTIGRRVFPFFIRRGLGIDESKKTSKVFIYANLISLVALMVVDIIWPLSIYVGVFSGVLAFINGKQLWAWTRRGVWSQPLLWVLVLGYGWIIIGFVLMTLKVFGLHPTAQSLHALTAGGIGMTTVGMMARVSLGHTGRNIYASRPILGVCFGLLMVSATIRVWLPLTGITFLSVIILSQIAWILGFSLFIIVYAPILIAPRIDGKSG